MEIFNLNGDEWNEETHHEGFAFKDWRIRTPAGRDWSSSAPKLDS